LLWVIGFLQFPLPKKSECHDINKNIVESSVKTHIHLSLSTEIYITTKRKHVQFFILFITAFFLDTKLSGEEDCDPINWFIVPVPMPSLKYVMVFFVFSGLRRELIVHFDDQYWVKCRSSMFNISFNNKKCKIYSVSITFSK
jgi:hypothetical protein